MRQRHGILRLPHAPGGCNAGVTQIAGVQHSLSLSLSLSVHYHAFCVSTSSSKRIYPHAHQLLSATTNEKTWSACNTCCWIALERPSRKSKRRKNWRGALYTRWILSSIESVDVNGIFFYRWVYHFSLGRLKINFWITREREKKNRRGSQNKNKSAEMTVGNQRTRGRGRGGSLGMIERRLISSLFVFSSFFFPAPST